MDFIKEEDQTDSGVQQHNRMAGSQDWELPTVTPEPSHGDVSSWVLLFGSFLLVFSTWCVKYSLYAITANANMGMNTIGAC